jgi:hypothetical protein
MISRDSAAFFSRAVPLGAMEKFVAIRLSESLHFQQRDGSMMSRCVGAGRRRFHSLCALLAKGGVNGVPSPDVAVGGTEDQREGASACDV